MVVLGRGGAGVVAYRLEFHARVVDPEVWRLRYFLRVGGQPGNEYKFFIGTTYLIQNDRIS